MDSPAHARFRAWFDWLGLSQTQLALRLGCDQSVISNILLRKRRPGVDIAAAVERESADWHRGPLLAVEWCGVRRESAKRIPRSVRQRPTRASSS